MGNSVTKDIQQLSGYVYHNGKVQLPKGWQTVQKSQDLGNGFYAEAFYRNGEIVVIYRGTDIEKGLIEAKKDLSNDYAMAKNIPPTQLYNAREFYDKVARKYAGLKFYAGGHS